jgi:hypothetical protein
MPQRTGGAGQVVQSMNRHGGWADRHARRTRAVVLASVYGVARGGPGRRRAGGRGNRQPSYHYRLLAESPPPLRERSGPPCCQRVTLASGRFAMIDNGLGFQLVPPGGRRSSRSSARRSRGCCCRAAASTGASAAREGLAFDAPTGSPGLLPLCGRTSRSTIRGALAGWTIRTNSHGGGECGFGSERAEEHLLLGLGQCSTGGVPCQVGSRQKTGPK